VEFRLGVKHKGIQRITRKTRDPLCRTSWVVTTNRFERMSVFLRTSTSHFRWVAGDDLASLETFVRRLFRSSPALVSWVFHDVRRDPGAFGFGRVAVHLDRLDATFGHGEQTQECLVGVAKYQQLTGEGRDNG
jgi:hypothetical protein